MLRQLKRNSDIGGQVHCLTVSSGGTKPNLLGHTTSFFIQPMAQRVDHALNHNTTACGERNPQNHVALNLQLLCFTSVLSGGL